MGTAKTQIMASVAMMGVPEILKTILEKYTASKRYEPKIYPSTQEQPNHSRTKSSQEPKRRTRRLHLRSVVNVFLCQIRAILEKGLAPHAAGTAYIIDVQITGMDARSF